MRSSWLLIMCYLCLRPHLGVGQSAIAEAGLPYLVNYPPSVYGAFSQNWAVVQDRRGLLYVGNGDGVLEFDGVSWRLIPVRNLSVVRSLAIDSDGTIFVGASREFGYLTPDSTGQLRYVSLLDRVPESERIFGNVLSTDVTPEGIYFHTANRLFRLRDDSIRVWNTHTFSYVNAVNGVYYIADESRGVFVVDGDSLRQVIAPDQLRPDRIRHFLPYSTGEILICMSEGPYYRFDGNWLRPLEGPMTQYLSGTRVVSAKVLPDTTYAFATYEKGLVLADRSGQLLQVINKASGLTTDLVFDVSRDLQGGLWLAMDNGLARVEPFSPLSNFHAENGLEGPVNGLVRHEGHMLAATGRGIYRLNARRPGDISARFELANEQLQVQGFSFLAIDSDLLIASGKGVFLIRNKEVRKVNDMRCSHLYRSPYFPDRVYVGMADGIGLIEQEKGEWVTRGSIANHKEDTRRLYEAAPNRLWGGLHAGHIVRMDLDYAAGALPKATIRRFTEADGLPKGYVTMRKIRGKLWFRRDSDMYGFDPEKEQFFRDSSLSVLTGIPVDQLSPDFEDPWGNLWLLQRQAAGGWMRRIAQLQPDSSYSLQTINSQRMTQDADWVLYPEGDSILWYGGADGMVRVLRDTVEKEDIPYTAYVRRVSFKGDSVVFGGIGAAAIGVPQFEYGYQAIRFEYAAPTFDAMIATRYQFLLEGFDADWSAWTTETRRDYTNLPEGSYRFRVRAINIYQRLSEEGVYAFDILPPWYRTWWAFSIYAVALLLLIWGIIRWRSRQLEAEKEALEATVRERTEEVANQNIRLEQQTQQLQALDMLKSRFFANISHEFRTPLTLILGPLEDRLARKEAHPDVDADLMMHRNAHRLLRLVNQLLDLSRLESGNMQLVPEKVELAAFFRAVIAAFHSQAEQKGIQFEIQVPDREWEIWLDQDKLENLLYNLLSNAFKFTPKGGAVQVKVTFFESEGAYAVRVHNTDSYIPTSQMDLIFDRFHQLESDSHQGTGIGLALVRELVHLYGGKISVQSDRTTGTAFLLELPVLLPATEAISSGETLEVPKNDVAGAIDLTGETLTMDAPEVLIVEDNEDVRSYLRKSMEPFYRIREAEHGAAGFQLATEQLPDLIVSDLMMPYMDGVELCRAIKTDERTSHIPVILLTAKADVESRIEGLQTGADDYLTKPFHQEELRVRIQNLIEQRRALRRRFSRQVLLQPKEVAITSADERFLERAMALVEQHLADPEFTVQAFRAAMGMSKTQLHRKLTALTDQSPVEFIRTYRLQRAAQLLASQYDNVSQVAFSVGFNNLSYFARSFKDLYGVNPSEYLSTR